MHAQAHTLHALPSSPNWFCTKVSDAFTYKHWIFFAFGAKNTIVILRQDEDANQDSTQEEDTKGTEKKDGTQLKAAPEYHACIVRDKSDKRVTAVAFVQNAHHGPVLVCGGEEGAVQIWDGSSLKMLEQHRKHRTEVMTVAVAFSVSTSEGMQENTIVASGDRDGQVFVWHRERGSVTQLALSLGRDSVMCLAIQQREPSKKMLAAGFRSGRVLVVDVDSHEVLNRFPGHEEEVQCMSWYEEGLSTSRYPFLLATSSKDKKIKIWNVDTSQLEIEGKIPPPKKEMSHHQKNQLWLSMAWLPSSVSTTAPSTLQLVSGSYTGQLYLWSWTRMSESKKKSKSLEPTPFMPGHTRSVFGIVPIQNIQNIQNTGRNPIRKHFFFTIGMDRFIHLWNVESLSSVWLMPSLGGFVYAVAASPIQQGLIAMGVGDNTIRVWQTSLSGGDSKDDKNNKNKYDCKMFWKGIQGKVTSLLWHPFDSALLYYGTENGALGCLDVLTNQHHRFISYHPTAVSWLGWRSLLLGKANEKQPTLKGDDPTVDSLAGAIQALTAAKERGENLERLLHQSSMQHQSSQQQQQQQQRIHALRLWSCSSTGDLLESNPDKMTYQSMKMTAKLLSTSATEYVPHSSWVINCFAWSPCGSYLAVGSSLGSLEIFVYESAIPGFVLKVKRNDHTSAISSLAWQPNGMARSDLEEEESTWLRYVVATGGMDGSIRIVSFTGQLLSTGSSSSSSIKTNSTSEGHGEGGSVVKVISCEGHTRSITSLAWLPASFEELVFSSSTSTSTSSLLCSSSMDGTVQIWTSEDGKGLANYRGHHGRVLSATWTGTTPHEIVSGSDDQSVHVWNYLQQSHTKPPKKLVSTKKGSVKAEATIVKVTQELAKTSLDQDKGLDKKAMELPTVNAFEDSGNLPHPLSTKSKQSKKRSKKIFHAPNSTSSAKYLEQCFNLLLRRASHPSTVQEAKILLETNLDAENECLLLQNDIEKSNDGSSGSGSGSGSGSTTAVAHVIQYLDEEKVRFESEGDVEAMCRIYVLEGKIEKALRLLGKEGCLNPTWVSLAPMAGLEVWMDVVTLYAQQLEAHSDYKNAAQYYLSLGNVRSAIRCLCAGHLYEEANAVAKLRLFAADESHVDIHRKWAAYLERKGDFLHAAQLFFSLHSYEEGIHCLLRFHSLSSVTLALVAAEQQNLSCVFDIAMQLERMSREQGDFIHEEVQKFALQRFPSEKVTHRLVLSVYRILVRYLKNSMTKTNSMEGSEASEDFDGFEASQPNHSFVQMVRELVNPEVATVWESATSLKTGLTSTKTEIAPIVSSQSVGIFWRDITSALSTLNISDVEGLFLAMDAQVRVEGFKQSLLTKETEVAYMEVAFAFSQFVVEVWLGYVVSALESFEVVLQYASSYRSHPSIVYDILSLLFPLGVMLSSETPEWKGELADEPESAAKLWHSFKMYGALGCSRKLLLSSFDEGSNSKKNLQVDCFVQSWMHFTRQLSEGQEHVETSTELTAMTQEIQNLVDQVETKDN